MSDAFDARYTEYQLQRGRLRRAVRRLYLASARSKLRGATLDFGCGVGELLSTLPEGSLGLEYNQATVRHCRSRGLDVLWYDGFRDQWQLSIVPSAALRSMVVSHVLEHLDDPARVLQQLLVAASRIGIERVLIVVPGRAGFRIDKTHRTFVDSSVLEDPAVVERSGFRLDSCRYFPINIRKLGDWLPHHELQALYLRDP